MFITFEGIENCGKSTQSKLLYEWLLDNGYTVILTREPGGTPSAEEIREFLLKNREEFFPPFSEVCMYIAARGFHVENLIKPELEKNNIVICDRFSDSTIAYQGYGRQLPINLIKEMDKQARKGITPDLTILIDIPVEESFKRAKDKEKDRIESEKIEFHKRVRKGFLELAKEEPKRIKVINGEKPIEEVFKEVLLAVKERLKCL